MADKSDWKMVYRHGRFLRVQQTAAKLPGFSLFVEMAHMTRVYQGNLKSFLCLARRTKAPQHHEMLFLNQYRYWSLKLMPSRSKQNM
jgi:hypothetical protein